MDTRKIGIVSDCPLQRHVLAHALRGYGFGIWLNCDPSRLNEGLLRQAGEAEAWVVDLADEEQWSESIDRLIEATDAPILFGMGEAPPRHSPEYPRWERRLYTKLRDLVGIIEPLAEHGENLSQWAMQPSAEAHTVPRSLPETIPTALPGSTVDRVWILGASLGGPQAVKAFLDALPKGLPVAFVYAQHIDAAGVSVLTRVLGRHSAFELFEAKPGMRLENGRVALMPVDREVVLDEEGCFVFRDTPWPGPYGPSIDQVMLNIANYYGHRAHAILFSGMGNDGAVAAPMMRAYGSHIWAQDSASCASASMPDAVADTGAVSFRGPPEALAAELVRIIESEIRDRRLRGLA
ncbi:chemotaxis protein CheB [Hahella sp. SMD15-11]|uniref:protein-glutamate methylesterase n=1 Tax=Thermohahella caldifontis TaxID=3142973 RepID=A0AB39UUW8_9GAMM